MSQICPKFFTDVCAIRGSFIVKRRNITPLLGHFIQISTVTKTNKSFQTIFMEFTLPDLRATPDTVPSIWQN